MASKDDRNSTPQERAKRMPPKVLAKRRKANAKSGGIFRKKPKTKK